MKGSLTSCVSVSKRNQKACGKSSERTKHGVRKGSWSRGTLYGDSDD